MDLWPGEADGVFSGLIPGEVEFVDELAHGKFGEGFEATFGEVLVVLSGFGFVEYFWQLYEDVVFELADVFGWLLHG